MQLKPLKKRLNQAAKIRRMEKRMARKMNKQVTQEKDRPLNLKLEMKKIPG